MPQSPRKRKKKLSPLILQVGQELSSWLAQRGLSKTAAAKLFQQPETYINNRVRGVNMTLRSLDRLFNQLGADVKVVVTPRKEKGKAA